VTRPSGRPKGRAKKRPQLPPRPAPPANMMPLLKQLLALMEASDEPFSHMAARIGYDNATFTRIRSGKRMPRLNTTQDLANALGYELVLRPLSKVAYDDLDKI